MTELVPEWLGAISLFFSSFSFGLCVSGLARDPQRRVAYVVLTCICVPVIALNFVMVVLNYGVDRV